MSDAPTKCQNLIEPQKARSIHQMVRHHGLKEQTYEIPDHRSGSGSLAGHYRGADKRAGLAAVELAYARNFRTENNLMAASAWLVTPLINAVQIV